MSKRKLALDRTFNIHGFDVIPYRSSERAFNALSSASVRHEAGYLISMRTLGIVLFECRKTAQSQIKTSLSSAPLEATARSLTQVQSGAKANLVRRQSVTRYRRRFSDLRKQSLDPETRRT